MRMMYMVLPKMSAYEFKDMDSQLFIKNKVKEYVKQLHEIGFGIRCFAENILALKLLNEVKNIRWFSVASDSDIYYMLNNLMKDEYLKNIYTMLNKRKVDESYVNKAVKRYTAPMLSGLSDAEYKAQRDVVFTNRIRMSVGDILEGCRFCIVFKSKGNEFCKTPGLYEGSGRFTIIVDLDSKVTFYDYGGIPLSAEQANEVLRSVVYG